MPESEGGSCSGAVSIEYDGVGVGVEGLRVGVAVGEGLAVGEVDARSADFSAEGCGSGDCEETVTSGDVLVAVASGVGVGGGVGVGSGVRVGLGEGLGDFVAVGVGLGSAMTSAHPREG
jgi:hypothetical protein